MAHSIHFDTYENENELSELIPPISRRFSADTKATELCIAQSPTSKFAHKEENEGALVAGEADPLMRAEDDGSLFKQTRHEFGRIPTLRNSADREPPAPEIYHPQWPLIRCVSVCRWPSRYSFYEKFRSDATFFYALSGKPCEPTPFFSYMPQYAQLNTMQRAWYLFWRDGVRRGEYLDTDESYLLLYIYEILNLPEKIHPEEGVRILFLLWKNYREKHRRVGVALLGWLIDYCLIHRLTLSAENSIEILSLERSPFALQEFLISALPLPEDAAKLDPFLPSPLKQLPDIACLPLLCGGYSWQRSRFYTSETASFYDEHLPGSLRFAMYRLAVQKLLPAPLLHPVEKKIRRDSYNAALCAWDVKRRLEVDYLTYRGQQEACNLVSSMVKCAENMLRGRLGLKARLHYVLPELVQREIQTYFDRAFPRQPLPQKAMAPKEEWEALYEAVSDEFSIDTAQEIEQSSWKTTRQLVGESEDVEDSVQTETFSPSSSQNFQVQLKQPIEDNGRESVPLLALRALLCGESTSIQQLAAQAHLMTDTLVEQVNELAYQTYGDVALERHGEDWVIVEDYREELEAIAYGRN